MIPSEDDLSFIEFVKCLQSHRVENYLYRLYPQVSGMDDEEFHNHDGNDDL